VDGGRRGYGGVARRDRERAAAVERIGLRPQASGLRGGAYLEP
jgi:hypothetical protein